MFKFAIYNSKFGKIKISYNSYAIVEIDKYTGEEIGVTSKLSDYANKQLQEYFVGERFCFTFPYEFSFNKQLNEIFFEIHKISYGKTRTFKDFSSFLNNDISQSRLKKICMKNPLKIVIPTHRLVDTKDNMSNIVKNINFEQQLRALEKRNYIYK